MSFRRAVWAVLAATLVVALLWWLRMQRDQPRAPTAAADRAPSSVAAPANPPPTAAPPSATADEQASHLADGLNSPSTDILADLRLVSNILAAFRSNLPRDGNPIGTNAEITAALTGKNKLRYAFIPRGHPAIDADGELCDRWGTPFFFHAESATHMAIRSAGPDKKMWNEDDVVFAP